MLQKRLLLSIPGLSKQAQSHRSFFGWLLPFFNKVDHDRIKEVGSDRACAEWLLKNGAHVKWQTSETFLQDYNSLPVGGGRRLKIQEVNANNASIMYMGFPYFKDLQQFDKLILKDCKYIDNSAMGALADICKDQLVWLEINGCHAVTKSGLLKLQDFNTLKLLKIENLKYVKDNEVPEIITTLKESMPKCKISYPPFTESENEIN